MTASDPSQSVDVVCRNIYTSVKQIIRESFAIVRQETPAHIYHHVVVILRSGGPPGADYLCSCSMISYSMRFIITRVLPVALGIQHRDFTFSGDASLCMQDLAQNPEISATHAHTHLARIQPLCSSTPQAGTLDLISQ